MSSLLKQNIMNNRRKLVKQVSLGTVGAGFLTTVPESLYAKTSPDATYPISLAQFSLASEFFTGKHDTLEFPARGGLDYEGG